MVECRTLPRRACMTYAAVLRKACSYVVWIGRAVEICQMARYTRGRESGEYAVFMALGTRIDIDMSARQGERGIVVVECRALPIRR